MVQKYKRFLFYLSLAFLCFFYIRLIPISLRTNLPKAHSSAVIYSNQTKVDLRRLFLNALDASKRSIHLVMFGLSDPQILQKIKKKSEEKIPVKIFYDPRSSPKLEEFDWMNAAAVREDHLMHQKILVIDQEYVYLGSANMTKSLPMHDNLIIGFHSPEMAQFLEEKTPFFSGHFKTLIGNQQAELWLLPDKDGNALNAIQMCLKNALTEIKLAMFTLTHPLLIDELVSAVQRGVKVTVAADYHAAIGASAKALQKLKEGKVQVILSTGIQLLHHKFLWVDQTNLIAGSANWTRSAFTKNRDAFLILMGLNKEQKKEIENIWNAIEKESNFIDSTTRK